MLITFQSPAHADVVMREQDARQLLRLMDHVDNTRGAIDAESVPDALASLEAGIAREAAREEEAREANEDSAGEEEDEEAEPDVGVNRRAWPLLQMLRAAADQTAHVSWHGS